MTSISKIKQSCVHYDTKFICVHACVRADHIEKRNEGMKE